MYHFPVCSHMWQLWLVSCDSGWCLPKTGVRRLSCPPEYKKKGMQSMNGLLLYPTMPSLDLKPPATLLQFNLAQPFPYLPVGLSTVPCTTHTYGAINTVPVPRPVTSEPCSDHTRRNLWQVPYGTILFTAITGGIQWIRCHHFTMKTRIKRVIRILLVLYGHGQIRNTIEACMPSDFQVLHIYLIPHTPHAQVCFTGDCDTTYDVMPYSPQG